MEILESREARYELVCKLLAEQNTLTLATVGDDGGTHAAPLYYLFRRPHLFWLSAASSLHSRALSGQIGLAVHRATSNWQQICGVQMRGRVGEVGDAAMRESVLAEYAERFELGLLPRAAMALCTLYQFTPEWIRYIDNRKYFGYKFEILCNEEGAPR